MKGKCNPRVYFINIQKMNSFIKFAEHLYHQSKVVHARILAKLYAHYRRCTSPIQMGRYSIVYETFCSPIQKKCEELGISIPAAPMKMPNKLIYAYLVIRFRWPWPTRMLLYEGKILKAMAISPEEMARVNREILSVYPVKDFQKSHIPGTPSQNGQSTHEAVKRPDWRRKKVDTNNERSARPSSFAAGIKPEQEMSRQNTPENIRTKIIKGAVIDNSF